MNLWRVKSKTGANVHLTEDREKTLCGWIIKDDWKFLYILNNRAEAMEHEDGFCEKCNNLNIEEWEKELVHDDGSQGDESERVLKSFEEEVVEATAEPVVEDDSGTGESSTGIRADRAKGLATW